MVRRGVPERCQDRGGIASGAASAGGHSLFIGKRTFTDGAVGVALCGNVAVESVVAQGCRPIGIPMFATRSERNFVLELDAQPALGVLQKLFVSLSPEDQALFRHSLFLGIVMRDAQQSYDRGDFLIRNIVGTDVERGAVAVAAHVEANQVVQFHLRDALTSAEDLDAALSRERASMEVPLAGALLFSCLGRGKRLYGAPNRDSAMFHGHFGGVPLGGFFCNGEIGPVQGRTFLHGYTASFGLFRPKRA
jgi:small ligand-binding sensory domain FIST